MIDITTIFVIIVIIYLLSSIKISLTFSQRILRSRSGKTPPFLTVSSQASTSPYPLIF